MNYQLFLFILNLTLLSRLSLTFKNKGASRRDLIIMTALPLSSLLFLEISFSWRILLIYLIAYSVLVYKSEKAAKHLNRNRIRILALHIISIGLLCSPIFSLQTNEMAAAVGTHFQNLFLTGQKLSSDLLLGYQAVIFGFLMLLNEINMLLRWTLQKVGLGSIGMNHHEIKEKDYNTGRIIGILERIFVFLFILLNEYLAIGFILAAKGVTRFKDFESRTFAEYVLIGTLISTLMAMTMAYLVMKFLT